MITIAKQASLAAAVSLAVLGLAVPEVLAQGAVAGGAAGGNGFRVRTDGGAISGGFAGGTGNRAGTINSVGPGYLGGAASVSSNPYASGSGGYGMNPYYWPYYPYYDNVSGYLMGAASVISSQGQFMINNQQAGLMKQQVRQAKVDSRRKILEEWLWERQNLPTLQDELERRQMEEFRRSRFDPPVTEIWSGKALNDLLLDIQQMHAKGIYGPPVDLDQDLLKQVNVTGRADGGNIGLLRNEGRLSWPLGLRDLAPADETKELRSQIDSLVAEATNQAVNGRVEPGILNQLRRNTDRLRQALTRNVGDMSLGDYSRSKRFLGDLDDAVKVLEQDNAGQYLNGKYSAQGKNVQELVQHMSRSGLRFASMVPGGEAAYLAVKNGMAAYAVGAQPELIRQPATGAGPAAGPVK